MNNFAELIKKIEQAAEILADEDIDLETSLKVYKQTQPLIKEAQDQLNSFELEIKELTAETTGAEL